MTQPNNDCIRPRLSPPRNAALGKKTLPFKRQPRNYHGTYISPTQALLSRWFSVFPFSEIWTRSLEGNYKLIISKPLWDMVEVFSLHQRFHWIVNLHGFSTSLWSYVQATFNTTPKKAIDTSHFHGDVRRFHSFQKCCIAISDMALFGSGQNMLPSDWTYSFYKFNYDLEVFHINISPHIFPIQNIWKRCVLVPFFLTLRGSRIWEASLILVLHWKGMQPNISSPLKRCIKRKESRFEPPNLFCFNCAASFRLIWVINFWYCQDLMDDLWYCMDLILKATKNAPFMWWVVKMICIFYDLDLWSTLDPVALSFCRRWPSDSLHMKLPSFDWINNHVCLQNLRYL